MPRLVTPGFHDAMVSTGDGTGPWFRPPYDVTFDLPLPGWREGA